MEYNHFWLTTTSCLLPWLNCGIWFLRYRQTVPNTLETSQLTCHHHKSEQQKATIKCFWNIFNYQSITLKPFKINSSEKICINILSKLNGIEFLPSHSPVCSTVWHHLLYLLLHSPSNVIPPLSSFWISQ